MLVKVVPRRIGDVGLPAALPVRKIGLSAATFKFVPESSVLVPIERDPETVIRLPAPPTFTEPEDVIGAPTFRKRLAFVILRGPTLLLPFVDVKPTELDVAPDKLKVPVPE